MGKTNAMLVAELREVGLLQAADRIEYYAKHDHTSEDSPLCKAVFRYGEWYKCDRPVGHDGRHFGNRTEEPIHTKKALAEWLTVLEQHLESEKPLDEGHILGLANDLEAFLSSPASEEVEAAVKRLGAQREYMEQYGPFGEPEDLDADMAEAIRLLRAIQPREPVGPRVSLSLGLWSFPKKVTKP
jgi:hypothetical protein